MAKQQSELSLRKAGDKVQVLDGDTGLVWRTLDTWAEAEAWVALAEAPKK